MGEQFWGNVANAAKYKKQLADCRRLKGEMLDIAKRIASVLRHEKTANVSLLLEDYQSYQNEIQNTIILCGISLGICEVHGLAQFHPDYEGDV